jgi:hypothetical protein
MVKKRVSGRAAKMNEQETQDSMTYYRTTLHTGPQEELPFAARELL